VQGTRTIVNTPILCSGNCQVRVSSPLIIPNEQAFSRPGNFHSSTWLQIRATAQSRSREPERGKTHEQRNKDL
jgi:hypothetical protein